jgi:hypothetical protein
MELATFSATPTPSTRTGPRRAPLRTDRARFMKNEDKKLKNMCNKEPDRARTRTDRARFYKKSHVNKKEHGLAPKASTAPGIPCFFCVLLREEYGREEYAILADPKP